VRQLAKANAHLLGVILATVAMLGVVLLADGVSRADAPNCPSSTTWNPVLRRCECAMGQYWNPGFQDCDSTPPGEYPPNPGV